MKMGTRILHRQTDLNLYVLTPEDGKILRCVEKRWLECMGELETDKSVFTSLWERSDDCDSTKIMQQPKTPLWRKTLRGHDS